MPRRIQRQRTKGWRTPICSCGCGNPAIYVGRPTIFGNRWRVGTPYRDGEWEAEHFGRRYRDGVAILLTEETVQRVAEHGFAYFLDRVRSAKQAVNLYRRDMTFWEWDHQDSYEEAMGRLAGHDLSCWCPLEDTQGNRVPCHADVLLELASGGTA